MHAVTFQIKRAHWQGVAFGKKVVRKIADMTPARFDLLYLLRTAWCLPAIDPVEACQMEQRKLQGALGLHPATISKMIKRLIEIGWLMKARSERDARKNLIRITEKGFRAITRAMRIVFRQRTHLLHFERFFKLHSSLHVLEAIDRFWWTVRNIAQSFGDTSTLIYDFGYREDRDPERSRSRPQKRRTEHALLLDEQDYGDAGASAVQRATVSRSHSVTPPSDW